LAGEGCTATESPRRPCSKRSRVFSDDVLAAKM
jgi:hypothetical protein